MEQAEKKAKQRMKDKERKKAMSEKRARQAEEAKAAAAAEISAAAQAAASSASMYSLNLAYVKPPQPSCHPSLALGSFLLSHGIPCRTTSNCCCLILRSVLGRFSFT